MSPITNRTLEMLRDSNSPNKLVEDQIRQQSLWITESKENLIKSYLPSDCQNDLPKALAWIKEHRFEFRKEIIPASESENLLISEQMWIDDVQIGTLVVFYDRSTTQHYLQMELRPVRSSGSVGSAKCRL